MIHLVLFLLGLCLGVASVALGILADRYLWLPDLQEALEPVAWLVWMGPLAVGMGMLYLLFPKGSIESPGSLLIGWMMALFGSLEYVKTHWPDSLPG